MKSCFDELHKILLNKTEIQLQAWYTRETQTKKKTLS